MITPAIIVRHCVKNYGERRALDGLNLEIKQGEIFCILGPNGGGKSTLFRILSTFIQPDEGSAEILGYDVVTSAAEVRARIGVVFQSPSLDPKLTVRENLLCSGALYGLQGKELEDRIQATIGTVQLSERLNDFVGDLSGGLQRRTEIAKCLLTSPEVLILDEPSTGLDPAARLDLWAALEQLRQEKKVTILCTTHIMDEAARADRVGILSAGKLVALGTPEELISALHGDVLRLSLRSGVDAFAQKINDHFGISAHVIEGEVRLEHPDAYALAARIAADFPNEITGLHIARPTLEDVFIARTGTLFAEQEVEPRVLHKKEKS
ncbi:MAG: ABC transporter ATP-binding protein [Verrucomicrobia bacterium]|nr:MAG: ABC transporter ATP-binding protein [Verrucomicrobiota bacterium]